MLAPGKIQHIICTGNVCIKEVHDYLKSLCPDMHVTRGEYDEDARYPETKTLTIGPLYNQLCEHMHQFKAYTHEGGVVINPGSATGAFSSIMYDVNPGFVLMDIVGLRVVVYVYELIDGDVKVDEIATSKKTTAY